MATRDCDLVVTEALGRTLLCTESLELDLDDGERVADLRLDSDAPHVFLAGAPGIQPRKSAFLGRIDGATAWQLTNSGSAVWSFWENQQRITDRPLPEGVGRVIHDLAVDDHRRGTATVEVQRILEAECLRNGRRLGDGEP